jgi:uncharacterized membrane protein
MGVEFVHLRKNFLFTVSEYSCYKDETERDSYLYTAFQIDLITTDSTIKSHITEYNHGMLRVCASELVETLCRVKQRNQQEASSWISEQWYTKSKMKCATYQREDDNGSQGDDQPHDSR